MTLQEVINFKDIPTEHEPRDAVEIRINKLLEELDSLDTYIDTTLEKDMVNSPHHYIGTDGLEVEQILSEFLPRFEDGYIAHRVGSAIEYLLRSPLKNGDEDLKKAIKNLEQALEHLGGNEE